MLILIFMLLAFTNSLKRVKVIMEMPVVNCATMMITLSIWNRFTKLKVYSILINHRIRSFRTKIIYDNFSTNHWNLSHEIVKCFKISTMISDIMISTHLNSINFHSIRKIHWLGFNKFLQILSLVDSNYFHTILSTFNIWLNLTEDFSLLHNLSLQQLSSELFVLLRA